jgi:hypothetical protein
LTAFFIFLSLQVIVLYVSKVSANVKRQREFLLLNILINVFTFKTHISAGNDILLEFIYMYVYIYIYIHMENMGLLGNIFKDQSELSVI